MPTLILLRHGESEGNAGDVFTGWLDVDLTPRGEAEARRCGELLRAVGLLPDRMHTSTLVRAVRSGTLAMAAAGAPDVSCRQDWRLNERHYGALQGQTRSAVRARYGTAQYLRWRRSWDATPPQVRTDEGLRLGESLADVSARLMPWWEDVLAPDLRAGHTVLVTAHSNSLRALIAHLDDLGPDEVVDVEVPTAAPLCYELDDDLRPTVRGGRYIDPRSAPVGTGARVRDRPGARGPITRRSPRMRG